MVKVIHTVDGKERKSTQMLLQEIYAAIEAGERTFEIFADGQHDIGGPLWTIDGTALVFKVHNPGQRVGSMCLPGTTVIVETPCPADVGWLNAGGEIIVKGDGGDTTGHCSASGHIYVGGRGGTRTGSLMKFDPAYAQPELWVLKNVGSFSFEFMSGGIAVVCGIDSDDFESVLGDRACIGMVGGMVYFRGVAKNVSIKDTKILELDEKDIQFLSVGLADFLKKIERPTLINSLTEWKSWKKIVALSYQERPKKVATDIRAFRKGQWVSGGIFGDVYSDNLEQVAGLVMTHALRLRVPQWDNYVYAAPCEDTCPAGIPTQTRFNLLRENKKAEAYRLILEYSPFPGSVCGQTCPNPCMEACTRCGVDFPADIAGLGRVSAAETVDLAKPLKKSGKKAAIIGSGVAGLSVAWHLVLRGHDAVVFEEDSRIGGKLEQVIPRGRLPHQVLENEINRLKEMGVVFKCSTKVDPVLFKQISNDFDAVVIASGSHISKMLPVPGIEKILKGLDFLKKVNKGEKVVIGKRVIVIGCGNSGMDVAVGAYQMGAEVVTCIDVQAPAAFEKEIEHVQALGGKLLWPIYTEKVTAEGLVTKDGQLIPGDTIIIAIGENPKLDYVENGIQFNRGCVVVDNSGRVVLESGEVGHQLYAAGDVVKPGRLVDAIGSGRNLALHLNALFWGVPYQPSGKKRIPAKKLHSAYFRHFHVDDLPQPEEDYLRCVSCGTCRDCQMCLMSCPQEAISRVVDPKDKTYQYVADPKRCIGCGICEGVCPSGIWAMYVNEASLS